LAVGLGWALTKTGAAVGLTLASLGMLAATVAIAVRFTRNEPLVETVVVSSAWARAIDLALVWVFVESSWPALYRGPGGVRIADVAALGLAIAGPRKFAAWRSRYLVLMAVSFALLCAGAALAAMRSGGTSADLDAMLRAGFVMLVLPLALVRHVTTERRLRLCLVAVVTSATVASLAAIFTKLTGAWLLPFADHFAGTRAYGLSTHPILFGMVAGSAIPVAIGLAWVGGSRERLLAWISLPVLVAGVVLSASRAPVLATAASAAVFFVVLGRIRLGMAIRFALVLIVSAGIAGVIFSSSVARLTSGKADQSSSLRLAILEAAAKEIQAHPLVGQGAGVIKGVGGLAPRPTYVQRTSTGQPLPGAGANNIVVQAWRALGLLGVVGLMLALVGSVTAGLRAVRRASVRTRTYCMAMLASLGAVLGSLFLANEAFERRLWLTVGLLIAVAVNQRADEWSSEREVPD
jgi:O-antigen ligase